LCCLPKHVLSQRRVFEKNGSVATPVKPYSHKAKVWGEAKMVVEYIRGARKARRGKSAANQGMRKGNWSNKDKDAYR